MKNIFIKTASLCFLFTTLFSCTNFVDDSNVDPDELTESDATNLFQGVILANQFFQTSSTVRDAMLWMNEANGEDRQYIALNNWNSVTASEFDDSWNTAYVDCVTQAKVAEASAESEGNPNLKGALQVIEAHCMGTVASLWGDVPYSELDITGENSTPTYDDQADVYESLQTLLDDAIVNLNEADSGDGIDSDKDIIYGGDASKWVKLAYSVKAKLYLQVSNYTDAKTNALLGIDNEDDDFKAIFGTSYGQSFNPFYSFLVYDRDTYMSGDGYAAHLLDPSNDLYRGNTKTDESARFLFNYLNRGDYFDTYDLNFLSEYDWEEPDGKYGTESPMPLVTYGEMLLIVAEADARTSFSTGLASYNTYRALLNTGYSIGIDNDGYYDQTYSYLDYDAADFDAGGIENTAGTLTNQEALLREIFEERYIYFLGNYESFTDFGRSDNTAGIVLKDYSDSPQRFLYPQVEINSNPNTPSPTPSITTKTPVHE